MRLVYSIIAVLIVSFTQAQDTSLFKRQLFVKGTDTLQYRILYPNDYDVNKKYPVVLFLHGAGERGNDNEKQLIHGSKLFLDSINRVKYPAFVLFPQCPEQKTWATLKREAPEGGDSLGAFTFVDAPSPGTPLSLVIQMMDSIAGTPQVDKSSIYIGGLSMGGMGTFEMLWRKPKFYAAAFPICGGGDPEKVKLYAKKFPIWVFHGDADNVVPVSNSRLMVNRLKAAGADVTYSEYPGVGHDSWNNAFAEENLLPWLFEQKRKVGRRKSEK